MKIATSNFLSHFNYFLCCSYAGNMDGRAGMAAVVLKDSSEIDMKKLYTYVTKHLPLYACPKFVRLMSDMHITVTFKHKKGDLAKEGFDPNIVQDPLYFLEPEQGTYVPLDMQVLQKIVSGRSKLWVYGMRKKKYL